MSITKQELVDTLHDFSEVIINTTREMILESEKSMTIKLIREMDKRFNKIDTRLSKIEAELSFIKREINDLKAVKILENKLAKHIHS